MPAPSPETRFVLNTDGTVDPYTPHPNIPELADLVAQALGVSPDPENLMDSLPPLPAPGHITTVYDGHLAQPQVRNSLAAIEPDVVMLHTGPGPEDLPDVRAVKDLLPRARTWIQTPANYLAGKSPDEARALGRALGRATLDLGAEVLSYNGESASHPGGMGWSTDDPTERARLIAVAAALLEGTREGAPSLVIAWSSHDCLSWHHLVWRALYGERSPVQLALHQHYPDTPGRAEGYRECLARFRTSQQQCASANIRADLIPGGPGAVAYTQMHGLAVDGAMAIYDRAQFAAGWAVPTRADVLGINAARADVLLRRAVGHDPGRVMRFQRLKGLALDGVCGPATLGALGVAH